MSSSSVRASPACTCSTGSAGSASASACSRRGDGVGGTWYWNRYPGRALRHRERRLLVLVRPRARSTSGGGRERYAAAARDPRATSTTSPTASTCAATSRSARASTSATFDEARGTWTVETDAARRSARRYCVMATGCLSATRRRTSRACDASRADWYHTGEWPHERVDFAGKRVGVIGTGIVGHPDDPGHRPAGRPSSYVLQRTPNYQHARAQPSARAGRAASSTGATAPSAATACADWRRRYAAAAPTTSAVEATRRASGARATRRVGRRAASSLSSAPSPTCSPTRRPTTSPRSSCATRSARSCSDPTVAELLCPTHHIGTKRICIDTGYFETFNRDNVELVDVSDDADPRDRPDGIRTATRQIDVDVIIFATGFDAMTGALADDRHPGARWAAAGRAWAGRPAHLPRPAGGRLPEPVHRHRPGQPVGAEQHDRLDRAARGLDRGLHRAPARDRRSTPSRPPSRRRTRGWRT